MIIRRFQYDDEVIDLVLEPILDFLYDSPLNGEGLLPDQPNSEKDFLLLATDRQGLYKGHAMYSLHDIAEQTELNAIVHECIGGGGMALVNEDFQRVELDQYATFPGTQSLPLPGKIAILEYIYAMPKGMNTGSALLYALKMHSGVDGILTELWCDINHVQSRFFEGLGFTKTGLFSVDSDDVTDMTHGKQIMAWARSPIDYL